MHQFGVTRSVRRQDHAVFTADTFVRAALPGMRKAVAIIHAAPAIGAAFTQYTAELESGGCLGELPTSCERFIYVIEGQVTAALAGRKSAVSSEPLEGDESIAVRHLLPDNMAFDCAVNLMTYKPGASLP